MMANWDAYHAMKAEAERIDWPNVYETDLTKHDRIRLSRKDAPEVFGWILRSTGTHLFTPMTEGDPHKEAPSENLDRRGAKRAWVRAAIKYSYSARFYWWNGHTLEEISEEEFTRRIFATDPDPKLCRCAKCRRILKRKERENAVYQPPQARSQSKLFKAR